MLESPQKCQICLSVSDIVPGNSANGKHKNGNTLLVAQQGVQKNPAMTYSRPRRTTIGPGCLTAVFGMGTGGTIRVCSPRIRSDTLTNAPLRSRFVRASLCIKKAAVLDLLYSAIYKPHCWPCQELPWGAEKRINAAKRSAVSTGRLRRLRALHVRPIDLVVFQEPSL